MLLVHDWQNKIKILKNPRASSEPKNTPEEITALFNKMQTLVVKMCQANYIIFMLLSVFL